MSATRADRNAKRLLRTLLAIPEAERLDAIVTMLDVWVKVLSSRDALR